MSFSLVPGRYCSLYYYTTVCNSLCSILRASSVFWSQSKCLTLPWNGYRMRQPLHRVTYSMFCGWDRLLFALSLARPTRTFQVWMTYKQCQMLWVLPPLRALSCVTCVIQANYVLQLKNVCILCAWQSMNTAWHDVVAIDWILTTAPVPCPIWAKVSHGKAAGPGNVRLCERFLRLLIMINAWDSSVNISVVALNITPNKVWHQHDRKYLHQTTDLRSPNLNIEHLLNSRQLRKAGTAHVWFFLSVWGLR